MILVIGGSGSGKSAYAEKLAARLSASLQDGKKYYIATMREAGDESRERIARHRAMRRGMGFATVEQPADVALASEKMEPGSVALLESVSNLVANEMFPENNYDPRNVRNPAGLAEKIESDILALDAGLSALIAVTDNVFADGCIYDDSVMEYMRVLADCNARLAAVSNAVVEVVAGIPVLIKNSGIFPGDADV